MSFDTNQKISFFTGSAALLPLAVAAVGLYGIQRLATDVEWVRHTHAVRAEIQGVARYIDGAKGDIRGFLLTGDSAYLRRHAASIEETEAAFRRASELTRDNPEQNQRLVAVRNLLTERELALQKTIALGTSGERVSAAVAERLQIGEQLAARIDSLLSAADAQEATLLAERSRRQRNSELLLSIAAIALALSGITLAFLFRRSIRRDLVGRARAEDELRASEAKFAGILDIAVDGIITVDDRQLIVHFNRGAETIFGYHRTEVIGQPLELLLPARHGHAHAAHLQSFASAPETSRRMGQRRQINGRRKNGDEFPAEASISKLRTPAGWLFTAVVRDVTENRQREQHEHALVNASAELANAPEYSESLEVVARLPVPAVGAWSLLDVVQTSETGERQLRRIAGTHPDPDVDVVLRELEALGTYEDSPEASIDVFRSGEPRHIHDVDDDWLEGHTATTRHRELFQQLRSRSLLIVPLVSHETVVAVWTIGSSTDRGFERHEEILAGELAERGAMAIRSAQLLRTAQRATQARDKVLGVVSHDLRNPLSAVTMLARRLVNLPASDEERRAAGTSILSAVDWMQRLIQDLLDISSIESGRLAVEPEFQSVAAIIDAAVALFNDNAKGVRLVSRAPTRGPLVLADGARIIQVLANLIGNAVKFTPENGIVEAAARLEDEHMLIWVRDTGCGIPATDLPHVFDRFWQARRGGAVRGHGLGLAIAQGIVKAHGGRIWVESIVGEGSTFYFTLPLASSGVDGAASLAVPALATRTKEPST